MTKPENAETARENIETSGRLARAYPGQIPLDSAPTEHHGKPRNAEERHRQMVIHPAANKNIPSWFFDKSMWPRP